MITKYKNFLNEGLFSSKYGDIVDKIYNYILDMSDDDIKNIRNIDNEDYSTYLFNINQNDVIYVSNRDGWNNFDIYINDDELDTKSREAGKIFNLIKKRKDEISKEERQRKISDSVRRIRNK